METVKLDWNDSGDPNMAYWIYYRRSTVLGHEPWSRITYPAIEGSTGTVYTFPLRHLTSGIEYDFRVGAVNGAGETSSNEARTRPWRTKYDLYITFTGPEPLAQSLWLHAKTNPDPDIEIIMHQFNWSDDLCSAVEDIPSGFDFRLACARHDFGYRNHRAVGLNSDDNRLRIDMSFYEDMRRECGRHGNRYADSSTSPRSTTRESVRLAVTTW